MTRAVDESVETLLEELVADLDVGFARLVRGYASAVYSLLLLQTSSHVEADDLGQETFLRAYAALRTYSPQRRRALRPRAWLMTIALNVWRNHVRSTSRRPTTTALSADGLVDPVEDGPGPEEHAMRAAEQTMLRNALARLPEHHRIPVVLRHVVGLTNEEIAHVLSCPVGTVKARISRGLKTLRGFTLNAREVSA